MSVHMETLPGLGLDDDCAVEWLAGTGLSFLLHATSDTAARHPAAKAAGARNAREKRFVIGAIMVRLRVDGLEAGGRANDPADSPVHLDQARYRQLRGRFSDVTDAGNVARSREPDPIA
jgi:hypothetical protein